MATSLHQGSASTSNVVNTPTPMEVMDQVSSGVVRLKLSKPEPRKKVSWTSETVDNEHMNKKKSKCCCVYVKPHAFEESSSDDSDGECEHCSGHVEKKKRSCPPSEDRSPQEAST